MTRANPESQRLVIGAFLFLAAVACAVAPLPLALRSAGALLFSYLAFAASGMPFAYLSALVAPPLGLLSGDHEWLVMLPIILSANLLAMLGLEYAWRYPALLVSPLLQVVPQLFVMQASKRELFAVSLPWEQNAGNWVALHGLVAVAGVLVALYLDRKRSRLEPQEA